MLETGIYAPTLAQISASIGIALGILTALFFGEEITAWANRRLAIKWLKKVVKW